MQKTIVSLIILAFPDNYLQYVDLKLVNTYRRARFAVVVFAQAERWSFDSAVG